MNDDLHEPAAPQLDIVTPTDGLRPFPLLEQGARLAAQMGPNDRWILVGDGCDVNLTQWRHEAEQRRFVYELGRRLLGVSLHCPGRSSSQPTLNQARHAGCSLARRNAWIVEVDDHDLIEPGCLEAIREYIGRGHLFLYGNCLQVDELGNPLPTQSGTKPDYERWFLRDVGCPCEGVRAFPAWLYRVVGGYRFDGPTGPEGNEFPAGDYGLFLRMEQVLDGEGFARIPRVLCHTVRGTGVSWYLRDEQATMARRLQERARAGRLSLGSSMLGGS